ncbi:MAG: deoxyribodipyrimidine photo-lyase [Chloroflexi bacterium]|nr:deoxyribodipyrimidine photo-lyase [Chloroflexota bacterium]
MNDAPVIHWFRRDLRLHDNLALEAAFHTGAPILPIFIFDPAILKSDWSGVPRLAFLLQALNSLDQVLQIWGGKLLVRIGDPRHVLPMIIQETGATKLFFNKDYSPFAEKRDQQIVESVNIAVATFDDAVLQTPGTVIKADGEPYTVFTPFKRQWLAHAKTPITENYLAGGRFYCLDDMGHVPSLKDLGFGQSETEIPEASEQKAADLLHHFMQKTIQEYAEQRNILAADRNQSQAGTSYLSPYFRFGLLSPRQVYWAARRAYSDITSPVAKESIETWVSELVWREFYMHILHFFPHVIGGSFQRKYDRLAWRYVPDELAAWQAGMTGYPVVDAAMRQLKAIGWMHNRARMIVASFLTKDLLIDWREGERHFMQWLIDGDPAANNGGWQWAAGTGTDAQPYFRIFNPQAQSEKFDPEGVYIRCWLPELRDVPTQFIHAPHLMSNPPGDYPAPIVEHALARRRALIAYQSVK